MGFRDWGLGVLTMSGPTVGIRWILKILHDPKYLIPWELYGTTVYYGHAGFLVSTVGVPFFIW